MMRCVLSLLFAMAVGTVAFAAEPPANQPPAVATPSTESFLASVAAGNRFEIDSSKLALERAKSATVKSFANRLVDEHISAGARLKEAVSQAKLPPPPDALDARHQAILDDLKACDAASFDKAYVEAQVQVLRETGDLFRTYATVGDNARIKRFAQDRLLASRTDLDDASKLR